MTGRDLVTASLRLIGVVATGETPSGDEATDGLNALNRMLGSWSNDGLLIHAITQETALTLTVGDSTYTLGSSGDITTRPQEIVAAAIRDGNIDYPLRVLSVTEFAQIANKAIQAVYPESLYDDGGYPRRTLTLYPTPSAAKSLVLWTKRPLTEIASLDTSISLPPGNEDALVYNLAERLGPEYGKTVPESILLIARETKAAIKRANYKPRYLKCDPAVVGGGGFDFNSGGYRS